MLTIERGTKTETETDRDRDRHTDRPTDRPTDRQTDTERQRQRQTDTDRQTGKHTYTHTCCPFSHIRPQFSPSCLKLPDRHIKYSVLCANLSSDTTCL